jgi:hypothetical protein
MGNSDTRPVDYTTHILIGRTSAGKMTVIWEWPHLPRQVEVQQKIGEVRETYATYLLCTPTSIMPAVRNGGGRRPGSSPFRDR